MPLELILYIELRIDFLYILESSTYSFFVLSYTMLQAHKPYHKILIMFLKLQIKFYSVTCIR